MDRKVIPLKKLTPSVHAEMIKTVEHHNDVRLERKTVETKIFKNTPPIKPTDPHQVGKLPAIPKHLETPSHVTPPTIPMVPKHVEKVVPKYDPPKPPKASPKPLPKRPPPVGPEHYDQPGPRRLNLVVRFDQQRRGGWPGRTGPA